MRGRLKPTWALIALAICGPPCFAEENEPLETLPHHIELRIEKMKADLKNAPELAFSFVIQGDKRWSQSQPISVCFVGGNPALNAQIGTTAKKWVSESGAKVDLRIGQQCASDDRSAIRVGFSYPGYWSLVGTDSRTVAEPGEITLNLSRFDVRDQMDPSFRTSPLFVETTLHEFGHAFGFQHEHQHPEGKCDAEFNWDRLYAELGKEPNNWTKEKVDHNLRKLPPSSKYILSPPDPGSIMQYSLPKWMFKDPNTCTCCTAQATALSALDKQGMRESYPTDPQQAKAASDKRAFDIGRVLGATASSEDKVKAILVKQVTSVFLGQQ